jgi:succinate dehydrogenase/fumarate reductase flavoprotein subunit
MTRAQVANVIGLEVKKGHGTKYGGLLLDLAPNIAKSGQSAWNAVYSGLPFGIIREAYGEKAFRWEEPWDVTPTAHFTMGGVRIDECGRSSLEGLYAAGEVAGGLHGGNRLGSVALTEIFVFGERAGEQAAKDAAKRRQPAFDGSHSEEEKRLTALFGAAGRHRPTRVVRRLQRAMWEKVGVVRDEQDLLEGLEEIETIARLSQDLATPENRRYNLAVADAVELDLMLDVARATTLSAQERRESRGAHVRSDFPDRNDEFWRQNIITEYRSGRIISRVVPVAIDDDSISALGNE